MEYYPSYLPSDKQPKLYSNIIFKNFNFYNDKNELIKNNRAIHNDLVFLKELHNDPENYKFEVVGIKKRNLNKIVGVLILNTNQKYGFNKKRIPLVKFTPLSNKYPSFMVPCKVKEKKNKYCIITINKWEEVNRIPVGKIEEVLGDIADIDNETNALLYKNEVSPKLKNKTQKKHLYLLDSYLEKTESNCDYEYETFSIDPTGCLDIDDAFHIKVLDNGNYELGIHIANIAYWLNNTNLDLNFFSSIYLNNSKQINMLDDNFTYNKSLGNGEIKKSISLIINYSNENNKILSYQFRLVNVMNCALSYNQVDKIIGNTKCKEVSKSIQKQILQLNNLYKYLNSLGENEYVKSTKIVEYFMLLYNCKVAETLYRYNSGTILRSHKLNESIQLDMNSLELNDYLNTINQNAAVYISKAEENMDIQHESLGFKYYTHATSPVRRFVDIINQINLMNYLGNKPLMILSNDKLDEINLFNKNLRKFYNNYKKLKLIYSLGNTENEYCAYVIEIKKYKMKLYIPDLDIEHNCKIISPKLEKLNLIHFNEEKEELLFSEGDITIKKYDKVKILLTLFPSEIIFNKKINIKIISPKLEII